MKKAQLFLFHFAGGNCYSFQFLSSYLKDFELIPLELPGRGRRMNERLVRDFDLAALDLFRQVKQRLTTDEFLIYGHSLGAYLALKVAGLLEQENKFPGYVFVSGTPGPGISGDRQRYLLGREAFIDVLKRLGGVPDEFINDKELFNLFEPVLRSDFELAEKNDISNEPPIYAPLFAMMGNEEEYVDKIANWGRFTRTQYNYEIFEGGHFFIHRHPEKIARLIKDIMKKRHIDIA